MIEYYLHLNALTDAPDDCIAKPSPIGVLTREDLIKECCAEGTGITPYEAESMFKRIETVVTENLEKGYSINTPLLNISPSITGVFTNWDDSFDGSRHKLRFKSSPGVLLKAVADSSKLHKIDRKKTIIDIYSFTDHSIGQETNSLLPNGVGELKGKRLKMDTSDENQGIFLIAEDGTEHRVAVYVTNTDSTQIFQIPELTAGNYELQVRCIAKNNKKLTIGYYDKTLSVK
ncbi:DNA-binding domain-containing protein [Labilibaculum euxinus]